jgi:hypothetical protein
MSGAHSPGPWTAHATRHAYQVRDAQSRVVAEVFHLNRRAEGEPTPKDDADLIAASTKLLAALETFVAEYVRMIRSGDCGSWDPETEDKVIAARAAIAAAHGRPA